MPEGALDQRSGITASTEYAVTIGSEYAVYAVTVLRGHCWYYILDDDRHPYPVWHPAALFDVVNPAIPPEWKFGYERPERGDEYPVLSFPEWALDPWYYERLVDQDPSAVEVFARRKGEAESAT